MAEAIEEEVAEAIEEEAVAGWLNFTINCFIP